MLDLVGQNKLLRILWGAFIVGAPVLAVAIGIFTGFLSANRSTPDKTLSMFCAAMKSGNDAVAYNQFSFRYRHTFARQQFGQAMSSGTVTSCSYRSLAPSGARVVARLTLIYGSGATERDTVILIQDSSSNNEWKIDQGLRFSTPQRVLRTFCAALLRGDYRNAYAQFSSSYQGRYPQQQLAKDVSSDNITSCTPDSVTASGTSALAQLALTHVSGVTDNDIVTLSQEGDNTWKIENGINLDTPLTPLRTLCSSLLAGDYATAYAQFSSDFQNLISEPQFTATFSRNKVTSCTYSSPVTAGREGIDTRATATVKMANTATLIFSDEVTLVQEGGNSWKIDGVALT